MAKLKIGIIGCGTIGSQIARSCVKSLSRKVELVAICDEDKSKVESMRKALGKKIRLSGVDELIKRSDIVIEAASARISGGILEKCIKSGKGCMVMSVGGLIGREGLLRLAEKKGVGVYIPSGAICGIDGLKSASSGRIDSVTITTRKPLSGLRGAPYLVKSGIDLSSITGETVLFEGSAMDAVKEFPQNINVSAVLSLAGIGARNTKVRIITSPDYVKNVHEVRIEGEFGVITTKSENEPSDTNPKTSALAIFSAISTLDGITKTVRIGT